MPPSTGIDLTTGWKYFSEPATWHDADELCQANGGYLISILSEAQNNALGGWLITEIGVESDGRLWLGGHDLNTEVSSDSVALRRAAFVVGRWVD